MSGGEEGRLLVLGISAGRATVARMAAYRQMHMYMNTLARCTYTARADICKRYLTHMLSQSASDRGPSYLQMSVKEGDGRVLQKYLTDLLYCDFILLSSVFCSIGTHSTTAKPSSNPNTDLHSKSFAEA